MGKTGDLPTFWCILVQWMRSNRPGGARKISSLQVCLEGSKVEAEDGAKLLCLSMENTPTWRDTVALGRR